MIKKFLILIIFFCFIFFSVEVNNKIKKKYIRGTYLKFFSKADFKKLLFKKKDWMKNQIKSDLQFYKSSPITFNKLDKTYQAILQNTNEYKGNFVRYRILNNKIYLFLPENKFIRRQFVFEKALRTLSKIITLPNIDIIYSDEDGTPLEKHDKNFYITLNEIDQAPIFSRAKKTRAKHIILIPDYNALSRHWKNYIPYILDQSKIYSWEQKIPIAIWRGADRKKERVDLCQMSLNFPFMIDAGFSLGKEDHPQIAHLIKNEISISEHLRYKYQLVLDGYMCTYPGYQWRLLSNSLAFKIGDEEMQWFYNALKPYEHYIPIKLDLSNLCEQIEWAKNHDEECKKISENATDFVLKNLQYENVYVYLYLLLKEYETVQQFSKKDIMEDLKNAKKWVCIQNRKKAKKQFKEFI
ncbi:MAG: hypothetical protein A3F40_04555 [Chlamydiae bacterium RIFCSPHIGHO2_12_FULL_27_8]|nr:MAG: hypothetical protein A3F40_04555 [Chlamydiae bacterium RIFCSPHIGHO2_12_FULL_27_8]